MDIPGKLEPGGVALRIGCPGKTEFVVVGEVIPLPKQLILHVDHVVVNFIHLLRVFLLEGAFSHKGHESNIPDFENIVVLDGAGPCACLNENQEGLIQHTDHP